MAERREDRLWLWASLVVGLALLAAIFVGVRSDGLAKLAAQSRAAASLRVQAVESILAKQRAVAAILSDDDQVRAAVATNSVPTRAIVSAKLERLHAVTQSSVIYLLNARGEAISASNWDEPASFVGQNYAFRDYFGLAIRNGRALQYALGTVSKKPGLYLASRVDGPQGPLGVVVVKVDFDLIEAAWAGSSDETFVVAPTGEVVLASDPAARFLPLPPEGAGRISVAEPVPGAGWMLILRVPTASVTETAVLGSLTAAGGLLVVALWLSRMRRARRRLAQEAEAERRYAADLARAVEERTRDLSEEMRERRMAETRLARMQADLVQANKLATLGQVTAGVAHEVNQPLATIRLLAENAQALLPRPVPEEVGANLGRIVHMTDRIAQITTELRSFSRKATGKLARVDLKEVIEASLLLTASRRRAEGPRLVQEGVLPGIMVMAEAVRLEQIFVNLIQNAQEALSGQIDPEIRLSVRADGDRIAVWLSDNGPGLSPETRANLFIPFSTSKPHGLGLGLVIAQGIARDFGGDLAPAPVEASEINGQGASFILDLARAI